MTVELASASGPAWTSYMPGLDDVPVTSDPGSALLALILQSRGAVSANAREQVDHANAALEEARRQMREALERAREAADKSGFWGDISDVLGVDIATLAEVVASAAAVAATGGASAPAVLALIAAGMSAGADVAAKAGLDPKLCAALALGGAAVGLAAGRLDAPEGFWANVAKLGSTTNAAATTAGSAARVVAENYRADSMNARAEATTARGAQDDAVFRFNQALEVLQKSARDVQRATTTVGTMVRDEDAGRSVLLAGMRAA